MPFINIRTAGEPLTDAKRGELIRETTNLMARLMGKKAELTSVRIEPGGAGHWGIGGAVLRDASGRAAHMDIKVTAGTNTDQEKAAMVEAGHDLLADVLGALPEATYVIIHEVPAVNWGYAGKTQAARAEAKEAA